MNFFLEQPPQWAYNFCYFWAILGVMAFISGLVTIYNHRQLGAMIALFLFVNTLVSSTAFFSLFWMCRASLRDTQ